MEKLIQEHRKRFGEFEVIDFVDEKAVEKLRDDIDVDVPMELHWTWNYGSEVEELRRLYEKGKVNQWNAETDLDWSLPVSKDEFIINPENSLLAQATQLMGKDEATQKAAAFDEISYLLSQLLHGEQAALQLCGQLTNVCDKMDEKWYAASQVIDEARHIEAMSKFLQRKLGTIYPIGGTLKVLLDLLLEAETAQKKTLGMQTLFEGMAVGIMDMLRSQSRNPLMSEMLKRVEQGRVATRGVRCADDAPGGARREHRREERDGGLGLLDPRGAQRQPAARHAPPAGAEVRPRPRGDHQGDAGHGELGHDQQRALHAHGGAEPAQSRADHRAHRGSVAHRRHDGRQPARGEGRGPGLSPTRLRPERPMRPLRLPVRAS